jgi:hypothetical protein
MPETLIMPRRGPTGRAPLKSPERSLAHDDDEDLSTSFFEASNSPSLSPVEVDLDDEAYAIRRLTLTPAGVARRAQLGRYVAAAVGLAALVGVVGAVRGRSMRDAVSAPVLAERTAFAAPVFPVMSVTPDQPVLAGVQGVPLPVTTAVAPAVAPAAPAAPGAPAPGLAPGSRDLTK